MARPVAILGLCLLTVAGACAMAPAAPGLGGAGASQPAGGPSAGPATTRLVAPGGGPMEVHTVGLTVTSPARRAALAKATAATTPGSACAIEVAYLSGPSEAKGLDPATADGGGSVSWSWVVGPNTTVGMWPVDVRCTSPRGEVADARQLIAVE